MYEKEVDSLLAKKYSKQTLKKVHAQWKKMNNKTVTLPHYNFVSTAKTALEETFPGTVHLKYSSELLVALKYTDNVYHFQRRTSLLENIEANEKIDFNDYQ